MSTTTFYSRITSLQFFWQKIEDYLQEGKANTLKIKFFLITDKVARNELQVLHKGTKDMIADIHTKPVQGSDFMYLRSEIMGILVEYDDDAE